MKWNKFHPFAKGSLFWMWSAFVPFQLYSQQPARREIAFVSDTQAPMWAEKLFLRSNQNERATGLIFEDILQDKPDALYILGDVVSLSCKDKKWKNIDGYIGKLRDAGMPVTALLGNHDVMRRTKKGIQNFERRFPEQKTTGYFQIVDSIAVVLLNSNFKKMSHAEVDQEQSWLRKALQNLDDNPAVRAVIVTCHHPPYTLSKIVSSSKEVRQYFVPPFLHSKKSRLFITGHAHAYEHFYENGKDFLTIGGGGGLHQPLNPSNDELKDVAGDYKPMFHYLKIQLAKSQLRVTSRFLKNDFSGFEDGRSFEIAIP